MPLTNEQRENRALYNLARALGNARGPMSRGQLHCASVRDTNITYLLDTSAVVQLGDRFALTPTGERELGVRIANGRGSTIS